MRILDFSSQTVYWQLFMVHANLAIGFVLRAAGLLFSHEPGKGGGCLGIAGGLAWRMAWLVLSETVADSD
jgi:hypothetical protein